jgi:hypothetical protein
MTRLDGEVRDREKVMRGLKNMDTPILKGYGLRHAHGLYTAVSGITLELLGMVTVRSEIVARLSQWLNVSPA